MADAASPLGPPLLAEYGSTFQGPVVADWLVLAGMAALFLAGAVAVAARRSRAAR